jgi:hypothetical protein
MDNKDTIELGVIKQNKNNSNNKHSSHWVTYN